MKKIIAVAKNELHLLFRRKVGYGVIALCAFIAIFMFFFARSDGTLLNELRIRTRYSFYFFMGLLNLILMYLACLSLRKEIDMRRFHTIAAAPVHRSQIWLGKFVGLLSFGILVFLTSSFAIGVCCFLYTKTRSNPNDKKQAVSEFIKVYHVEEPLLPSINKLAEKEYDRRKMENRLPVDASPAQIKRSIYDDIRRKQQLIEPNGEKTWDFAWNPRKAMDKQVILKFKFYTDDKMVPITGTWNLSSRESGITWSKRFTGYAYQFYQLKIPARLIPSSTSIRLAFQGESNKPMVFPIQNGITLLYADGTIFKNFVFLAFCVAFHFAALIALSLTLCSFFSYSVAIFMNVVIYTLGSSSGFFTSVAKDLAHPITQAESPVLSNVFSFFIHVGLTISNGVKFPPVVANFSEGLIIPMSELAMTWGPGLVLYIGLVTVLGVVVLTRKEIDKELHN